MLSRYRNRICSLSNARGGNATLFLAGMGKIYVCETFKAFFVIDNHGREIHFIALITEQFVRKSRLLKLDKGMVQLF